MVKLWQVHLRLMEACPIHNMKYAGKTSTKVLKLMNYDECHYAIILERNHHDKTMTQSRMEEVNVYWLMQATQQLTCYSPTVPRGTEVILCDFEFPQIEGNIAR